MPQTTIKYTISPDGKRIKETVEGVTGKSCKQLTKPIEDSLGDVIAFTQLVITTSKQLKILNTWRIMIGITIMQFLIPKNILKL